MDFDAIIIGAGACGLMCAVQAGYLGKRVLILEKNDKIGAKILISGGGRCNFTNLYTEPENFISQNKHFPKSALSQWTVQDTLQFFETYGITGAEKTLGQLFPTSNKAKDIVQIFENLCREFGQKIITQAHIEDISIADGYTISYTCNGKSNTVKAAKLVLATGGLPISKMGATDFALRWARKLNMPIVETAPALVPLTITGKDEQWYAQLAGNSVFSRVSCAEIAFEENILFTHWGLSGPAILQISSYWRQGMPIEIDLLPHQNIIEVLNHQKQNQGNRLLTQYLQSHYTKKMVEAMGKFLPIDKNIASLSNADMENIAQWIHHFKVKPAGDKGYDKAEVMRGGVDTQSLSSKTLESKQHPNLYFGGECLDVTGWLGGYNFQWAWACGYVIAQQL